MKTVSVKITSKVSKSLSSAIVSQCKHIHSNVYDIVDRRDAETVGLIEFTSEIMESNMRR